MDQIHIGPGHLDKFDGIGQSISPLDVLYRADRELNQRIVAYNFPHTGQYFQGKPAAVAQGSSILVLPCIGPGREELVKQPAMACLDGNNIHTCQLGIAAAWAKLSRVYAMSSLSMP